MPGGRPTLYSDEMLSKAEEYIQTCVDEETDYVTLSSAKAMGYKEKIRVKLPSITGLALYLSVDENTVNAWADKHPEFFSTVMRVKMLQKQRLVEGGLSNSYNPKVAALLLSANHGMREGKDVTTNGKDLPSPIVDLTKLGPPVVQPISPEQQAIEDDNID